MFRAIQSYDGSSLEKCISLVPGDILSEVHTVDEKWLLGHNERSRETGVFPASCVVPSASNEYSVLEDVTRSKSTSGLQSAEYANVAACTKSDGNDNTNRDGTLSFGAKLFDEDMLESRKQKKKYRVTIINPKTKDKQSEDADAIELQQNIVIHDDPQAGAAAAASVYDTVPDESTEFNSFDEVNLNRLHSVPESEMSWFDSSFEQSYESKYSQRADVLREREDGMYHKMKSEELLQNTMASNGHSSLTIMFGIMISLAFGGFVFLICFYCFGYKLVNAAIIVGSTTLVLSLASIAVPFLRSIVVLLFPSLFCGKGTTTILAILFGFILSYPMQNIIHNLDITGNSMVCFFDLLANQSASFSDNYQKPFNDIIHHIQDQTGDLALELENMKFKDLSKDLEDFTAKVDNVSTHLRQMAQKCRKPVTEIINRCNSRCLGAVLNTTCVRECNKLFSVAVLCDDITSSDAFLFAASRNTRAAMDLVIRYFSQEIKASLDNIPSENNTRVKKQVLNEKLRDLTEILKKTVKILQVILSCSIILLFINAFGYLRKYLKSDDFDNVYISTYFKEIEQDAVGSGNLPLLPLKKWEIPDFVNTSSFGMNTRERKHYKKGFIQLFLHFVFLTLITLIEVGLFYVLDNVRHFGDELDQSDAMPRHTIEIEGDNPVVNFYRILFRGFDIDRVFIKSLKANVCLPDAERSSAPVIVVLVILYIIAILIVTFRGHGKRLRRKVAAFYYPVQEMYRILYLRKKIINDRISFNTFLPQYIRSSLHETSVLRQLSMRRKLFGKCLQETTEYKCLGCGQGEGGAISGVLSKCSTVSGDYVCEAVFCQECWVRLNGKCPVCY